MTVTLENDLKFNLVDSVNYEGSKYFAATSVDEDDDNLYFFKYVNEDNDESLQLLKYGENTKVIEALIQHIENTFE